MPLTSTYDNGVFYQGQWLCGCNKTPVWHTSKQPPSKGERFLRCPSPWNQQCDFFVTANDELKARVERQSDIPPVPRTPQQRQASNKRSYPTPDTDRFAILTKTPRRTLFGKSPSVASASRIDSGGKEGDLTLSILEILENDSVALKASTRLRIVSLIEDFQIGLEGRLAASNASLERVLKCMGEMEEQYEAGPGVPNT